MNEQQSYLDRLRKTNSSPLKRIICFLANRAWTWGLAAVATSLGIGLGFDYWLFETTAGLFTLAFPLATEVVIITFKIYFGKHYKLKTENREKLSANFIVNYKNSVNNAFAIDIARKELGSEKLPAELRQRIKVENYILLIIRQFTLLSAKQPLAETESLYKAAVGEVREAHPKRHRQLIEDLGQFLWPLFNDPSIGDELW